MLAAPRQRRFLSDHQPNLACGEICQRRAGSGATGQVRGDDRAFGAGGEGHRAASSLPCCRSPSRDDTPPLEMAPAEQKERTIAALMALFEGLTKDAPVLALLEDAHWIDPTSLDVFSRLIDRLPEPARAAGHHLPPRIRRAVGRPRACRLASTEPLWASAGAGDGRWRCRRQGAARRSAG